MLKSPRRNKLLPLCADIVVRARSPISEHDLAQAGHWLVETFGRDKFFDEILYLSTEDNHGPIPVADDSCWYDVSFKAPFYGVGYERGDWRMIKTLVAGLGERLPNVEIWYGNDCSTESFRPFDEYVEKLDPWFAEHGNEPYLRKFRRDTSAAPSLA